MFQVTLFYNFLSVFLPTATTAMLLHGCCANFHRLVIGYKSITRTEYTTHWVLFWCIMMCMSLYETSYRTTNPLIAQPLSL